jgi:hypothetical protein
MTKELAAYLRGRNSYFGYCQTPSFWKQWKRGKRRYAKLRHLGSAGTSPRKRRGIRSVLSYALPIAYFDSLGLPRLFEGVA